MSNNSTRTLKSVDGDPVPVADLLEIYRCKRITNDEVKQELRSSIIGLDADTLEGMLKFNLHRFESNPPEEYLCISIKRLNSHNLRTFRKNLSSKEGNYPGLIWANHVTFGEFPRFSFTAYMTNGRISPLDEIEVDLKAGVCSGRNYRIGEDSSGFTFETVSEMVLPLLRVLQEVDELKKVKEGSQEMLELSAKMIFDNFERWKKMSASVDGGAQPILLSIPIQPPPGKRTN